MPTYLQQCIDALKNEQEYLWADLGNALRRALNGHWSMETESLVQRIIWNSKVVGFTDWGKIPMQLISSGVYKAVLTKCGVDCPDIDLSEYTTHSVYPPAWVNTIAEIANFELETP